MKALKRLLNRRPRGLMGLGVGLNRPKNGNRVYTGPWYVDPVGGSDSTGTGAQTSPLATIAAAQAKATYLTTHSVFLKLADGTYEATPPQLAKLKAYWNAATVVGNNGDAVSSWPEAVAGRHATQSTANNKPSVLASAINSRRGIEYDQSINQKWLSIPNTFECNSRNITWLVVSRVGKNDTRPLFVTLSGPAEYGIGTAVGVDVPIGRQWIYWAETGLVGGTGTRIVPVGPMLHGVTANASGVTFHCGPDSYAGGSALASDTRAADRIGGYPGMTNFDFFGCVCEILCYEALADISDIRTYLASKYGLFTGTYTTQVAYAGNSLTSGTRATEGLNYPSQVQATLPATCKGFNIGIGARTCAQMLTDAADLVTPHYNAGYGKNIICVWEGRNDCAGGATKEQAYTNLAAYCAARKAEGWLVVVLNCIATQGVGDWEASQAYINAQLAANYGDYADALVNLAGDARLQNTADTTYFADTVHLTTAGYGVVAGLVAPAVAALLEA